MTLLGTLKAALGPAALSTLRLVGLGTETAVTGAMSWEGGVPPKRIGEGPAKRHRYFASGWDLLRSTSISCLDGHLDSECPRHAALPPQPARILLLVLERLKLTSPEGAKR